MSQIHIVGAGLAGTEAAFQLAESGLAVSLYDMKPQRFSPAHQSPLFAELVCSNSLRSARLTNGVGLLQQELKLHHSLIMTAAEFARVPAGGALAVDRDRFSGYITERIHAHPLIDVRSQTVRSLDQFDFTHDYVLIATGPLTDQDLYTDLQARFGENGLHFFDAIAPIVYADSLDHTKIFRASRYGRGDDYLNCPLTKKEYLAFRNALLLAETVEVAEFDRLKLFSGCLPIEAIAAQGEDTLRFGPLKPVGLKDPRTGEEPYAVVQLRQDNQAASLYNLVGFQTRLTHGAQRSVLGLIPGLANARYARFGDMHRNTFINSPTQLSPGYRSLRQPHLFFGGQITGVEGYIESTASGLAAALSLRQVVQNEEVDLNSVFLDPFTMMGALAHYVAAADPNHFQPMNANFGLLPTLSREQLNELRERYQIRERGKQGRRLANAARALSRYPQLEQQTIINWLKQNENA